MEYYVIGYIDMNKYVSREKVYISDVCRKVILQIYGF
jgi:hypothetical protein